MYTCRHKWGGSPRSRIWLEELSLFLVTSDISPVLISCANGLRFYYVGVKAWILLKEIINSPTLFPDWNQCFRLEWTDELPFRFPKEGFPFDEVQILFAQCRIVCHPRPSVTAFLLMVLYCEHCSHTALVGWWQIKCHNFLDFLSHSFQLKQPFVLTKAMGNGGECNI